MYPHSDSCVHIVTNACEPHPPSNTVWAVGLTEILPRTMCVLKLNSLNHHVRNGYIKAQVMASSVAF